MTPRPFSRIALGCLLAAGLMLPSPPVSMAEPIPGSPSHRHMLATLELELRDITVRLGQVANRMDELSSAEAALSALVTELKQRPPGMMRDAQLQDALQRFRTVLAARRSMGQRRRILITTLKTRQVALSHAARKEANLLIIQGERLVHHGDDLEAWERFAEAFDYLTMGNHPPSVATTLPVHPTTLQTAESFPLDGTETPDELIEIAQILRDAGEKAKWHSLALQRDLARLVAERKTVVKIRSRVPWHTSEDDALVRIDRHILDLQRYIVRLRERFAAQVGRAGVLEARARLEETVLLNGEPKR